MLGRAYFDLGEFGPAAKALQQAGDHDDAMLLLAQLYQQQGKTAQARKVYERFLKVHADHAKAAWVKRMLDAL
jgi:cytochrome c-type biogenesis protein CcmH/NrfG